MGTVLGALTTIIGALLTPMGMVITAAVAMGAYLIYMSGMGARALAWLGERFEQLRTFAVDAFGGIADALAAGDIALAAKILWLSLKVAWVKGVSVLESAWLKFRNFFIKLAYDAFYGAVAAFEFIWHGLEVAWIETTAFLSRTWTSFTAGFTKAWNTAVTWTEKRIHDLWALFDEGYDAEAAKAMADQALASTNAQIDQDKQSALQQREQRRQGERASSAAVHEATLAQIGQESLDKDRELAEEYAQRIGEAEAELARTKAEWQEAIAQARQKRQEPDAAGPESLKPGALPSDLNDLEPTLQLAQKKTIKVAGTFGSAALWGLGSGDVSDRIANATEATAKNTREIVQRLMEGGLEFE